MEKLIAELTRLYLVAGSTLPDTLARHIGGQAGVTVSLASGAGLTRAIVIPFTKVAGGEEALHWTRLCSVANALQGELGLPAPAVSIAGDQGYGLWLSLATPMPTVRVQAFLALLHQAYFADFALAPDAATVTPALPPCLHPHSGKWSAFIHPGMGASFADESGLDMAPPVAGQAAFLEGLHSISDAQFAHALAVLAPAQVAPAAPPAPPAPLAPRAAPVHDGLLLRDATLEDIVQFLHAKNIEPTFRHVIPRERHRLPLD